MKEKWKKIKDFEDRYEISNFGRVKSLKRNIIKKPFLKKDGYLITQLCKNGINKKFSTHRLVALHFIDNKENKPHINHIDGNKRNNKSNNLEWVTPSENMIHCHKNNLQKINYGEDAYNSKLTKEKVIKIKNSTKMYKDLAIEYGVDASLISRIKNGHRWSWL